MLQRLFYYTLRAYVKLAMWFFTKDGKLFILIKREKRVLFFFLPITKMHLWIPWLFYNRSVQFRYF